ncbi:MAG: Na(+)-translocating NADH-quinone reductase subunit C [Gammaproteobacteria bacterium]|nr:Na(+)-translocating NADH-quinone reductase subunit C [Gammaproteobacteria bacterium]
MNHEPASQRKNPLLLWLSWSNEDKRKTIVVATLLSLVCSLLVATSVVVLKPRQQANKQNEIQRNILTIADVPISDSESTQAMFARFIEVRLVNLENGRYEPNANPAKYDWRGAMKDPGTSKAIAPADDIAKIKRRPTILPIYLVKEHDRIKRLILPVYGYGLWSTLYGFLALEADAQTVAGLSFYEQAETPGLGGEVDNPKWKKLWKGKQVYDNEGQVKLEAIRGHVNPDSQQAAYQVDGLSGATLTTRGVSNLLHFWLSDKGFKPFLQHYKEGTL